MLPKPKYDEALVVYWCKSCNRPHLDQGDVSDCWGLGMLESGKHYEPVTYTIMDIRRPVEELHTGEFANDLIYASQNGENELAFPSILEMVYLTEEYMGKADADALIADHIKHGMRRLIQRLIAVRLMDAYRINDPLMAMSVASSVSLKMRLYCESKPREAEAWR